MAFGRSMGDSDLNLYFFWYLTIHNMAKESVTGTDYCNEIKPPLILNKCDLSVEKY
jgi:hypothetical protein